MEKEINIKKIWGTIKKRIWIVILLAIIFSVAAGIYSYKTISPLYSSTTKIVINVEDSSIGTLNQLLKEPVVLQHVVDELNLPYSPEGLSGLISISQVNSSKIYEISVTAMDSKLAVGIANSVAKVYQRELGNLIELTTSSEEPVEGNPGNIKILNEATESTLPINDNNNKLILAGFVFGILAGLGLIFLLDSLDDTVKTTREIENLLDIPVLGSISKVSNKHLVLKKKKHQTVTVRGESVES